MTDTMYPELFEPFNIGNCTIKNRVVMTPMDHKRDPWNEPYAPDTIAYYVERAKGGAGLIISGVNAVISGVEMGPALHSEFAHPVKLRRNTEKLIAECHRYGTKVFMQLVVNFGRASFPGSVLQQVAVSEGPDLWAPEITNRALRTEEIERIIWANVLAAKFFRDCGADGVNFVGPYGMYLADQFCIDAFNHRTDKFGGSMENMARFTSDMVRYTKKLCGADFPVIVRMGTKSHLRGVHKGDIPGDPQPEFGRDIDQSIEFAKLFRAAGTDAFLIGNGAYDALHWQYSPTYMPEGLWIEDARPLTQAVDVPVICPGRILMPDMANEAIKDGAITAVALGRALLADPYWPKKAEAGHPEEIRPCIGCNNGCIGRVMSMEPMMCAVNPDLFHERTCGNVPAVLQKKVAVIGAGIGGMQAAMTAKLRGHEVTVYEASDSVGGIFRAASAPEFKHGDSRLIDWYALQLKKLGIPVCFGRRMSADDIRALGADEIILATGSKPKRIPIPGLESTDVAFAADVLTGDVKTGKSVAVIGAGLIGCETALLLSADPDREVNVVEAARYIMLGGAAQPPAPTQAYMEDVLGSRKNVHFYMRSLAKCAEPGTLTVNTTGVGEQTMNADTIVLAAGLACENALYDELKPDFGTHIYKIGDCSSIGNIMTAIESASQVASEL